MQLVRFPYSQYCGYDYTVGVSFVILRSGRETSATLLEARGQTWVNMVCFSSFCLFRFPYLHWWMGNSHLSGLMGSHLWFYVGHFIVQCLGRTAPQVRKGTLSSRTFNLVKVSPLQKSLQTTLLYYSNLVALSFEARQGCRCYLYLSSPSYELPMSSRS